MTNETVEAMQMVICFNLDRNTQNSNDESTSTTTTRRKQQAQGLLAPTPIFVPLALLAAFAFRGSTEAIAAFRIHVIILSGRTRH